MPHARRALVTGASGQDGTGLCEYLIGRGYEVLGTTRLPHDARAADGRLAFLDLAAPEPIAALLSEFRPDEVYHLAGPSSVGLSFKAPVETFGGIAMGTLHVLEGVRTSIATARIFIAGSGEVFGDTGGAPAREDTPFSPRSPYGVAKAATAWLAASYREAYGLFACTGFLFNHESPSRSEAFVTRKVVTAAVRISRGSSERVKLGNLDVHRDWGWSSEYVEAMHAMLQQAQPRDFIIASGETISLVDFTAAAFARVGLDWRDHVEFDALLARPTDIAVVRADPSAAAEHLGWRARTRGLDVARRMVDAELAAQGD